jgi:hypothetical protein
LNAANYIELSLWLRTDDAVTQAVAMCDSDKYEKTITFLTTHQHIPDDYSLVCW